MAVVLLHRPTLFRPLSIPHQVFFAFGFRLPNLAVAPGRHPFFQIHHPTRPPLWFRRLSVCLQVHRVSNDFMEFESIHI